MNKNTNTKSLSRSGIVAALYVVVTVTLSAVSFGAIQIRVSETFNYLAIFNKRYIYAVTMGVAISNLFSPLGVADVFVGSLATFCNLYLTNRFANMTSNINKKYAISFVFSLLFMVPIAAELNILLHLPFWFSLMTLIVSEAISMTIGLFFIKIISKRVDLYK